jgi:hypothetical protein
MRRWAIRITGGIVLLLLAIALTIQIILWTDLPRRWILHAVNSYTGLVVNAESISSTWMGRTTLRNVTLHLPLDKENFFSVDSVDLSHRSIPGLIFRRPFGLGTVRIRGPRFYLRRAPDDRWNVQDIVSDLVLGVGGGRLDLAGTQLPEIRIEDASVHIIDPNNKSTIVGPFSFEGLRQTGRSWAFALASGPASARSTQPAIDVRGTLVENKEASHVADFRIEPNESWVTAIWGRDPGPIHIIGHWTGRVPQGGLTGAVRLEPLSVGPVTLTGTSRISQQPEGVRFNPDNMVLRMPALEGREIRIDGGSIIARSDLVEFERVRGEMPALGAQLNGRWDLDAEAGELTASWAVNLPGKGEHNGVSQIAIKSPSVGRKEARVSTTLAGQGALGSWRVVAQTQGSGAIWQESRWRTTFAECTWLWGSRQATLDGATADITLSWPVVRLIHLSLPDASQVQAAAEYDIAKRQWFARLTGRGVRWMQKQAGQMDVRLNATGTDQGITVSEFRIAQGPDSLSATGELALPACEVRNGRVQARWRQTPAETGDERTAAARGQWGCDVNVAGPVNPLGLVAGATVTGDNVIVGRRTAPKLEILLRGNIDSEQVTIETDPFHLFGGLWQARGQHQLAQPLTHLNATVEGLPVQAAAEMAGLDIGCEGSARAQIEIAVPNLDLKQSRAQGTWDVNQLRISPLKAQQARGRLQIGGGLVQFDDIELSEGEGKARGGLHFALDQPQHLFASFATSKWPVVWPGSGQAQETASTGAEAGRLAVLLDSKADLQLDLARKSTDGEGWFSGQLLSGGRMLGQTGASVSLRNGIMEVNDLTGDLLGGTIEGSARIPVNQWTASAGQLRWRDVQMSRLAVCWPPAERLEGTFSGTLAAVEATDRVRALEPIRLELKTSFAGGHVGAAQVGDCQALAFLGRRRLLIDKFDMLLCGGHLSAWGQLSPHTGILSLSMGTDFNDIDLHQLAALTGSERTTIAGKLAGQGTIITTTDWKQLNGEARVNISQSDLGDNPVIRTFYDALRLSLGPTKPVGTGQLNIRFSGARIAFPSFVYFNRGVEIRGAGQIDDFHRGGDSMVQGYAVGSTRVLKNVQLPGISELDRLMATLQSSAVTVVIRGTVGKPEARVVPLPEVRNALRYLLWQQLRENNK